jgi:DNA recombination protein RmuC
MEISIYILIGLAAGAAIGWLIAKATSRSVIQSEKDAMFERFNSLDKDFATYRAATTSQQQAAQEAAQEKQAMIGLLNTDIAENNQALTRVNHELSTVTANLEAAKDQLAIQTTAAEKLSEELKTTTSTYNKVKEELAILVSSHASLQERLTAEQQKSATLTAELEQSRTAVTGQQRHIALAEADNKKLNDQLATEKENYASLKSELATITGDLVACNQLLATANAENKALKDNLETQKKDIEELGKKFNMEFENIANKILDNKTEKFTELNKSNLKDILDPLGKNLTDFKTKVEEVYDKEAKERFSLGEKVRELALLNQVISEDAKNLTRALKGEAKTQGRWGEMILENILERSGLVKDREYFMEHELLDEDGKPLKSASEGKKMRPDAVIKYPDNRSVIIDSKVSLNAFTRLLAALDPEEQKRELTAHVLAIKNHIAALSSKGYDDYNNALDFVMLFVPSEPAYIAALQSDPDLWNYAYDKRILLLSPTNLITSLKLIVDLWKREYQNKNAIDIAERGAKLYDKFVLFVKNLTGVGDYLEKAQGKYSEAYKQLTTGNDNLVLQTDKLRKLGVKTKNPLPAEILNAAISVEMIENSAPAVEE